MGSNPPLRINLLHYPEDARSAETANSYDGSDGADGSDGINGTSGVDGAAGRDGVDGVTTVVHQYMPPPNLESLPWGPHCYVRRTSNQSIPPGGGDHGIGHIIDFGLGAPHGGDASFTNNRREKMWYIYNAHNSTSNPHYAPTNCLSIWYPGIYVVTLQVCWAKNANGTREISITENTLSAGDGSDRFDYIRASSRIRACDGDVFTRQSISSVFSIDVKAINYDESFDYVRGYVRHSESSAIDIIGGPANDNTFDWMSRLSATWLAPQYDLRTVQTHFKPSGATTVWPT